MLEKIKHLCQRLVGCCKAFPGDIREFSWAVAIARFWDILLPRGKSKRYIQTLSDYMCAELSPLTQQYAAGHAAAAAPKQSLDKIPVWTCWWQGEEQMPPMVKICIERLRQGLPDDVQLHIITWENMHRYLDLPEHVLRKYRDKVIGMAHLSDVLRFGLLSAYGGAWVDSTVYLSNPMPRQLFDSSFFTQRFSSWDSCPQEACRGKWCGFYLGGKKDNVIFPLMYEALCRWWSQHDRVPDYVFFDYILWAGYCDVPQIREQIDAVSAGNEQIWLVRQHLNDAYEPEEYRKMMASGDFFKLSYNGDFYMETADGRPTVYAHILQGN